MPLLFPRAFPVTSPIFIKGSVTIARRQAQGLAENGDDIGIDRGSPTWQGSWTTRDLDRLEFQQWESWLASLRGVSRFFLGWHPLKEYPVAYMSGGLALPTVRALAGSAWDWTAALTAIANGSAPNDTISLAGLPNGLQLSQGDLIELAAGTDLLTQPQAFDNAAWTKTNTTVTANAATAPDGTTTADKLLETTANANHTIGQALTAIAGDTHTEIFYVKPDVRTFCRVIITDGANSFGLDINLSTGATAAVATGTLSGVAGAAANVMKDGSGWWRVVLKIKLPGTSYSLVAYTATALGTISFTGVATSGFYIWNGNVWDDQTKRRSLHQVIADTVVTADANGLATLQVEPEVPAFQSVLSVVNLYRASAKWRLAKVAPMEADADGGVRPGHAEFQGISTYR